MRHAQAMGIAINEAVRFGKCGASGNELLIHTTVAHIRVVFCRSKLFVLLLIGLLVC